MFEYFNQFKLYNKIFLEIKWRCLYIIISWLFLSIICFLFKEQFIYILSKYLLYNMSSHRFIFTELTTILTIYLQFIFFCSIYIQIPFIIIHFCYFFLSSFYYSEWRVWLFVHGWSIFLYILSIFISYKFIFPGIIHIFLSFETKNLNIYFPLHFEAKINEFFYLMFRVFFMISFCFQIPIILYILYFFNIIYLNNIIQYRKIFYIIFLFISAIISPPEIINQLIIFFFIVLLFEILIIILLLK